MSARKPGVYETFYGNAAVYRGGQNAYDLDMGQKIPAIALTDLYLRDLEPGDAHNDDD